MKPSIHICKKSNRRRRAARRAAAGPRRRHDRPAGGDVRAGGWRGGAPARPVDPLARLRPVARVRPRVDA